MGFDFTLVLTAAVNPNGMTRISTESVQNREQQYIDTLSFYAQKDCILKILFVENSNWDLMHIKESVPNQEKITYLSLDENNFPREWGKGYGEFLLMDRAYDYLASRSEDGLIIKATGRFPILNIETMLQEFSQRKNLQLALDIVDHPFYTFLPSRFDAHHARTILYAIAYSFYKKYVYGRYKEIPSHFEHAEHLMFDVVKHVSREGVYDRFKHEPCMTGFAGSAKNTILTANNYDSILAKTKRAISQFCRTFLPFVKI